MPKHLRRLITKEKLYICRILEGMDIQRWMRQHDRTYMTNLTKCGYQTINLIANIKG